MLNAAQNLFDSYSRQARLFPALLIIFIPLINALAWFPYLLVTSVGATFLTLGTSCGILYALSSLARTLGRRVEKTLLRGWGGWPTTILLRHSSSLDVHTRSRYHNFLDSHVPGISMPTAKEELLDPRAADLVYDSAIKWLKERTREKDFPLLEKENAQYGFRRNLLGCRWIGLIGCLSSIVPSIAALGYLYPKLFSNSFFAVVQTVFDERAAIVGTLVLSLIATAGWFFLVTSDWVREAGEQYAETQLAACDKIGPKTNSEPRIRSTE